MSIKKAAVPAAPINLDGGFLITRLAEELLRPDEQELLTLSPMHLVTLDSQQIVDTSTTAPVGAVDEVMRAYEDGLPAVAYRLANPKYDKFTPTLNDKGMVDDMALIRDVLATISPDFSWHGPVDRHHLYWPRAHYSFTQYPIPMPAYNFRNHASNIIRVQRLFHNWIHAITLPPPMPDPVVMRYTLDAWEVVGEFFGAVKQTVNHQRLFAREELRRGGYSEDQKEMVKDMLLRELGGVVLHLDALQRIPQEYWPFRRDVKLQIAAGRVGQVLRDGYLNRTRTVRLARVA